MLAYIPYMDPMGFMMIPLEIQPSDHASTPTLRKFNESPCIVVNKYRMAPGPQQIASKESRRTQCYQKKSRSQYHQEQKKHIHQPTTWPTTIMSGYVWITSSFCGLYQWHTTEPSHDMEPNKKNVAGKHGKLWWHVIAILVAEGVAICLPWHFPWQWSRGITHFDSKDFKHWLWPPVCSW